MYIPSAGDRILVRRSPGRHTTTGVITGTVLGVETIGGRAGVIRFRDDRGGTYYLGTDEQLAEIDVTQTIEPLIETG